ncbi:hypothetical protein [Breznakiella homolactica]|uniref:Guanylate cyclase domain-containing protein n=1 Tax=Breznakiella homolactica TaxID=2798577 RepID=A0A7T7XRB0_9SPIR|nr:hypothetical protein [Breznakiella homolactica]QQO11055.1 hypothetical protein JFL75_09100 [Breznakiella homolactica]
MRELNEYTESTSEYELFSHIYDRILGKEITTFSALKEYMAPILKDKRTHPVVMRGFELIKCLNWGFFSGISKETHRKIWRELVIPDQHFPDAGNLKRTISISNLYVAMLDIHGYTKFCQDSRKNLSMLHTLDKTINNEIRKISTQCSAVSQRERGDEIVLVSASATDAITAALSIIDYFAMTNVVNDPAISTQRTGDAEILPVFKISAGIAGGNTSIPLIVTEAGNLSGFLLNTAARLQARANELSPKESRVMITKQVYINYAKENSVTKSPICRSNAVYFFDTGLIEFKGVMLPTCEVVFKKEERYKEKFSEEMNKLYTSIRESLWEQKVYLDLMDVIAKTAAVMPQFKVVPKKPINGIALFTNDSVMQLCRIAIKAYLQDEDYPYAVELLREFIAIMEEIPGFDRLILDYTGGIAEKYEMLLKNYEAAIDKQVDEKITTIFTGNHLKTYYAAKNGVAIYEKMRTIARKSPGIAKKKVLWYTLIKQNKDRMTLTIYSGKK